MIFLLISLFFFFHFRSSTWEDESRWPASCTSAASIHRELNCSEPVASEDRTEMGVPRPFAAPGWDTADGNRVPSAPGQIPEDEALK